MAMTLEQWLAGYRDAWEQRDPAAAAALFTEDSHYCEQPYETPYAGREGVRAYWTTVTATQEDVQVRYGSPLAVGNRAAVEWWVTMRNGGADITLAGEFMLEFDDEGLCRELREYWHFSEGRLTPQDGWGE